MPKDSGSSAAAPDYRGAAEAQGQSSKENLITQTWANRPQLNTPWGQQTWSAGAGTDPATGQPITKWTSDINLTPEQQRALDSQQRVTEGRSYGAETLLGQAVGNFQQPMNWNALPGSTQSLGGAVGLTDPNSQALDQRRIGQTTQTTNEPAFAAERQRIENTLFDKMRPEHQRQEASSRTRLANMGLTAGSEAYNRELERLQGTQAGERFNAFQTAGGEQQRMQQMLLGQQQQAFGQDAASQDAYNKARQGQFQMQMGANAQNFGLQQQAANFQNQARQQAIAEEQLRRGMPLNELNALLTQQQIQNPAMPSFSQAGAAAATPYMQAAQAQGDYQAQTMDKGGGSDWGSLLGTAAKVAAPFIMSDRRLKRNIVPLGRGWYAFSYLWDDLLHFGVMAQEQPHAAVLHPSGYWMVDYERL